MSVIKFEDYMHVGVIVNNIEETIAKMEKIFKIDEYRINLFPPENVNKDDIQLMYKGKKTWFTARFCFMRMGNTEIELIQPLEGESLWRDYLNEHGEGLHHLKFEVDSINETMKAFKEMGVDCPQYGSAVGPNTGKIWAYFDTTKELGYVSEILNRQLWETID